MQSQSSIMAINSADGSSVLITSPTMNTSGHKNSLKGTKFAKRARSFKEDIIEKLSMKRTPTNTLGRAQSPHSPGNKKAMYSAEEMAKSQISLEAHVKDICNALKHFRDVTYKRKFEVLPGNGTVILETIASMFAVIQSYALNENSVILLSATQGVNQALANLLKLCDECMVSMESEECDAALSNENVKDIVDQLEEAVKNLVAVTQQKLKEKEEVAFKYDTSSNASDSTSNQSHNHLMRPTISEVSGQRTSLPDINLTPKERDILEKNNSNPIRASHSTESILRDTSPPPKPPLPNHHRVNIPPPLPPKRRSHQMQHQVQNQQNSNNVSINSDLDCGSDFSILNYGVDHLSLRSRSPDENSSQCSIDSAFNHSREEEESKHWGLDKGLDQNILEDNFDKVFAMNIKAKDENNSINNLAQKINNGYSPLVNNIGGSGDSNKELSKGGRGALTEAGEGGNSLSARASAPGGVASEAGVDVGPQNYRHSNESGFVSMNSVRTSTQSVSKRCSEFTQSSSNNKSLNSEIAFEELTEVESNECYLEQQRLNTKLARLYSASASASSTRTTRLPTSAPVGGEISLAKAEDVTDLVPSCQSSSTITRTQSLEVSTTEGAVDLRPPALPPKIGRFKERQLSQFDNFEELDDEFMSSQFLEKAELRPHQLQQLQSKSSSYTQLWQTRHQSLMGPWSGHPEGGGVDSELPPPLPAKQKKHILRYMEICSAHSRLAEQHRHTMHTYVTRNISHSQTVLPFTKEQAPADGVDEHQQTAAVPPVKEEDREEEIPPALPPKNYKKRQPLISLTAPTIITTPPPSPKTISTNDELYNNRIRSNNNNNHNDVMICTANEEMPGNFVEQRKDDDDDDDDDSLVNLRQSHHLSGMSTPNSAFDNAQEKESGSSSKDAEVKEELLQLVEEADITRYLVMKKENEDGPDVKGGHVDALIVYATIPKTLDNAFSEAFITTFRTFIQPIDLIEKLTHRYTVFFCQINDIKLKAAKETFSLLVRVVNDLTSSDFTKQLFSLLVQFVYQLVCSGQLYQAKLLRNKLVEKVNLYKELRLPPYFMDPLPSTMGGQQHPSLLDFKSVEIAEQMTLLDAELFQKIEIPEVLLFAKEQCEEKSPNLNKFTEHFNKMSYWARSKILTLPDAKEREKYVIKFIKIMKHLRKMNNYNSYLALLSALDSAPVRRLEWHKTITEGLKEYCTLIDSSSSFRIYRQALAETSPPCIPYIGLVLQDLTFVHVGNPDHLRDGVINFSKRWQQYNIIVNMKRFSKCAYPFKRSERIIRFFENFENFLGEEEMWQISETIKPRGSGRRSVQTQAN